MGSSGLVSRLWLPLTLTLSPFALKKRDGERGFRAIMAHDGNARCGGLGMEAAAVGQPPGFA
jgi:hypothetical protein